MIKLVGILFVISSTVIAGFYYGNIETYRIYDLIEIKRALSILKSEVEFAMTPLPEAFINIARRVKNPIDKIFDRLSELSSLDECESIASIWEDTINEFSKDTYLTNEDLEQIIAFGQTLGYLDKNMQLNSIDNITEYIDDSIKLLNKTRFNNMKMYRSLGVLGGILVVVVCI